MNLIKNEEKLQKFADIIADKEGIYRTKVMKYLNKIGFLEKMTEIDSLSRSLKLNDIIYGYFKYFNDPDNISEDMKTISDGYFTLDIDEELTKVKNILIEKYKYKERDIDISYGSKNILKHLAELSYNPENAKKVNLETIPISIKIGIETIVFNLEDAFEKYNPNFDECLFEFIVEEQKECHETA